MFITKEKLRCVWDIRVNGKLVAVKKKRDSWIKTANVRKRDFNFLMFLLFFQHNVIVLVVFATSLTLHLSLTLSCLLLMWSLLWHWLKKAVISHPSQWGRLPLTLFLLLPSLAVYHARWDNHNPFVNGPFYLQTAIQHCDILMSNLAVTWISIIIYFLFNSFTYESYHTHNHITHKTLSTLPNPSTPFSTDIHHLHISEHLAVWVWRESVYVSAEYGVGSTEERSKTTLPN